jgi:apolipoprotein N-acyltransferase
MLAIASGVLQVIIFPKLGWTFLSWICLAPLLYALLNPPRIQVLSASESNSLDSAHALSVAQGFFLGYLCGIVCYAGSCYWIYRTMRLY